MTGEKPAGVFDAGGTLVGGFEEVAHLSGDVAKRGHGKEMRERNGEPVVESVGDDE